MLTEPVPAQAHALPFHCKTWPLAQLVVSPTTTLPLVPPPTSPDPAVTPVMVPAPGKVCPEANLIRPLPAMFIPVSVGLTPAPNKRFSVPVGVAVLLPAGSACHWKNWLTGAAVVLLNDEASIMKGSELNPALAVAAPWLGNSKAPRTRALPPTSSVVAGVVLLIPILAPVPDPDWKIAEFVMSEILSHRGTKVAVPAPVTGPDANGVPPLVLSAAVAGPDTALCSGVARTNADGGSPPIVSASLAFSA